MISKDLFMQVNKKLLVKITLLSFKNIELLAEFVLYQKVHSHIKLQ